MTLNAKNEKLLQDLVAGELNPDCAEAVHAFESSAGLRGRWEELSRLRGDLNGAAKERVQILQECLAAPTAISPENVEKMVLEQFPVSPGGSSSISRLSMLAASIFGVGLLGWWSLRPVPAPRLGSERASIVLNERVSDLEWQTPKMDGQGQPVFRWTDPNGSLFVEYVVIVRDLGKNQPSYEVLRSPRLQNTSWFLSPEQSAMLPKWGSITVSAYRGDASLAIDTSDTLELSFEDLLQGP